MVRRKYDESQRNARWISDPGGFDVEPEQCRRHSPDPEVAVGPDLDREESRGSPAMCWTEVLNRVMAGVGDAAPSSDEQDRG